MHHKVKIVLAGLADFTTENNMGKWEDLACKTPGKNVHTIYYPYKKKLHFRISFSDFQLSVVRV